MKRTMLLTLLIGLGLFIFGAGNSYAALSFTDPHNFSGNGSFDGRDYIELSGSGNPFEFSYNHNVTIIPPAASISYAQVVLSHHNNSNNSGEVWFLEGANRTSIGTLADSTGNGWVDQVFVLPDSLYSTINGGTWSLQLVLKETTSGTDKLQIDQSVLSGAYVATPIPPAAWLLCSGLLGLVGIRRRMGNHEKI